MIVEGRFAAAIAGENSRGFAAVIPDIKCRSPKEGDLLRGRDPLEAACKLAACGAAVMSVVTERERFGGSPELLRDIIQNTGVPVLRKDFITEERQLEETVKLGASAILLICSMLDEDALTLLYAQAIQFGLEPFVETHTVQELELAGRLGARLIGINNREIATMELDDGGPSLTANLAGCVPKNALLISESGIVSPEDARLAVSAGANAVLVGTALWNAPDMEAAYRSLRVERGNSVCGRS